MVFKTEKVKIEQIKQGLNREPAICATSKNLV